MKASIKTGDEKELVNIMRLVLIYSFRRDTDVDANNFLVRNCAIGIHSEKFSTALKGRGLKIVASELVVMKNGVAFNLDVASNEPDGEQVVKTSSRLEETIRTVLQRQQIGTKLLAAGHRALDACLKLQSDQLPTVKAAPASQVEPVILARDYMLLVNVANGAQDVSAHRGLLRAAEAVNNCKVDIAVHLKKEVHAMPALPEGASKVEWVRMEFPVHIGLVTGVLQHGRVAEINIRKKIHPLAIRLEEVSAYMEALRKGRFVKLQLRIARPGNPFHSDEPKFSIERTLEFLDEDMQKELPLPREPAEQALA